MDQGDPADAAIICAHSEKLPEADKLAVRAAQQRAGAHHVGRGIGELGLCLDSVHGHRSSVATDERGSRREALGSLELRQNSSNFALQQPQ